MDSDKRNIDNRFWNWTTDLIKEDLQNTAFPAACLMENFQHDFNIASLFRAANAFNLKNLFYIGKKSYDKRGTVGTHFYSNIIHLKDTSELDKLKEKYTFVGLENNVPQAQPMDNFVWPKNPLFIFGEEGIGITPETLKKCDKIVYIPQFGSVRSLNAAQAGAVTFYDYTRKLNERSTKIW